MISAKTSQAIADIYPNDIRRGYYKGDHFFFNNFSCIWCMDVQWNNMFTTGILRVNGIVGCSVRGSLRDTFCLANKLDVPVQTELNGLVFIAIPGESFFDLLVQYNKKQKQLDGNKGNYCPL